MNKYKARQRFLESVDGIIEEIASLGIAVEGSENTNDHTSIEVTIAKEEGVEEKLKKLQDFGELSYEGYILSKAEDSYRVIYCLKSPNRLLQDELFAHLVNLGFLIKEVGETSPNKGLVFSLKTKDSELLKELSSFKKLIFDGYTPVNENGEYNVFYIFSKED